MILELGIRGFKSLKKQNVRLSDINILIGGNGIGKSNFISAFELMKNIYKRNLQNYVLTKGGANSLLYLGRKNTSSISIGLDFDHEGNRNRYTVTLDETQDTLYIKDARTGFLSGDTWHYKLCDTDKYEASLINDRTGQSYYVGPLIESFEVYHFHDTGDTSPMKKKTNIDDNRYLRSDGSNIAAFLFFIKERYPECLHRIEHIVSSVSPFFDSFILEPNRLNPELIELRWRQRDSIDVEFNINQLSDGTLRFICLTTLLMQPEPPRTIIIDEPELGLHPAAIDKVASMIKKVSKRSQVIISTQSVNFVDNFTASDIIVVDRVKNESVFRRLDAENLKVWLDSYSLGEIWEKNIIGGQPL